MCTTMKEGGCDTSTMGARTGRAANNRVHRRAAARHLLGCHRVHPEQPGRRDRGLAAHPAARHPIGQPKGAR